MQGKEDFQKLFDSIMDAVLEELSAEPEKKLSIVMQNGLKMLSNLNKRLEVQIKQTAALEKRMKNYEKRFTLLIHELKEMGYIKAGERRKYMKRTMASQEAIISLLKKKKLIHEKDLNSEIKERRKVSTDK